MAETFFERVESALGAGSPKLVYQPMMRYPQRDILGLEALFRWQLAATGELCTPVTLFPQLQPQHTSELFFWVLDQASQEVQNLTGWTGYQGFVSVNMEADQLGDPDLWSRVTSTLEFHELPPSRLVLEITERRAIPDFPTVQRNLKSIQRSRVRLAMDDFGEGFASLDYVRQLQPSYLKLSGQMTRNMPHDTFNTAVVRLAVGFAQATGASLVVEGVEWAEQAKALSDMGVRDMQGYLFGKPAPIEEWATLLKRPQPQVN
ncbi:MAG: EAL domain-containing protein [Betaproteobacteria bacterium]|nr:EAL domain-containing protein [Betaproteobacteria bacterium]MDE2046943.1 EAL domain-containing protein [Betaproteobacteria bacterium]